MKNPLRRDPIKPIRDELAALDARRATLEKQRDEAAAARDAARKAAQESLLDGREFDDAALAAAERRVAVLDETLTVLQDRRDEAQARVDAAEDNAAREAEATSREKAAAAVEKAAARIDDLVLAISEELKALRAAIPACSEVRMRDEIFGDGPPLPADRIASQILADALQKHDPQIFMHEHDALGGFERASLKLLFRRPDSSLAGVAFDAYPSPAPLSALESAHDLVAAPLIASAARIRRGDDPANAPASRNVAPHSGRNIYNDATFAALESDTKPAPHARLSFAGLLRAGTPDFKSEGKSGLDWGGVAR